MTTPICVEHACEMLIETNGAIAVESYRPGTDHDMPYAAWAYDRWRCPLGGERILNNRASQALARDGALAQAVARYASNGTDALRLLSREAVREQVSVKLGGER